MAAFTVEITRTVTSVDWTTYLVYADNEEAAQALAQAVADKANAAPFIDVDEPVGWERGEGTPGDWSAQKPEPASEDDELQIRDELLLGELPEA